MKPHSIYRSKSTSDTNCPYALFASSVILKVNSALYLNFWEKKEVALCYFETIRRMRHSFYTWSRWIWATVWENTLLCLRMILLRSMIETPRKTQNLISLEWIFLWICLRVYLSRTITERNFLTARWSCRMTRSRLQLIPRNVLICEDMYAHNWFLRTNYTQ